MPADTPPESPDAADGTPEQSPPPAPDPGRADETAAGDPASSESGWSLWDAVPDAPATTPYASKGERRRVSSSGRSSIPRPTPTPSSPSSHKKRKKHRKRRHVRWGLVWTGIAAALLVVVVGGAIAGFRFADEAKSVQAQLESAKTGLTQLSNAVKAGNQKQMTIASAQITDDVGSAARTVNGPLWDIAARVPVVGANVDAVQRVTRAMNILTSQALQPGLDAMSSLKIGHLALKGGGIDLKPFKKAEDSIPTITSAFEQAKAEIAPIDRAKLMTQVSGPVDQIGGVIDQATPSLQFAKKYLPTLLSIAGGNGKKTYLLIFQNNAESRATGGNPAASMIMSVDDGRFKEMNQANSTTFYTAGTAGTSYTRLAASAAQLYRSDITTYSQNFTMTPDFPTTATMFQNLFEHTNGQRFNGVISLDPVVLSQMLAVTGPVTLSDGTVLNSGNAVKVLLSDVYEKYQNGPDSDAFFSDASKRVFNHLVSTSWDPTKMLDALTASAEQQRIYLNFTDKKAQALAVELGVDGALKNRGKTTIGMYLNDSSVSKLEYWLTQSVNLQCNADKRTATETITLTNSVPDAIQSRYTLGERNGSFGLSQRTMMLDVFSFAPPGGSIVSTKPATGQVAAWNRSGSDKGSRGVSHTVFVPQGGKTTVAYTVKLPKGHLGQLDLRYTPTARQTKVTVAPSCDTLFAK